MTKPKHFQASDLLGVSRLGIDAVAGVTQLVAALHHTIARTPGLLGGPVNGTPTGITGLVYRSVLGANRLVGSGLDAVLAQWLPVLDEQLAPRPPASREREAVLSALNGVLGDYLAESASPLAISLRLRSAGQALVLSPAALAVSLPDARSKIVVLVHGLCMNDRQWQASTRSEKSAPGTMPKPDLAAMLASELGYTPLYLHYNSGRHISDNGAAFAGQLQVLLENWPVPVQEMVVIGHSMGGLVSRSACHYAAVAGLGWLDRLRALVFLGTPHHGAPLEQGGQWLTMLLGQSPYTAPFARLGKLRSAGITDLGHGNLRADDWQGRDRFEASADPRKPVPLPPAVACYAIAATKGKQRGDLGDRLLGDGLVPVASALGQHPNPAMDLAIPVAHQWIGYGLNHLDLLDHPDVCAQVLQWLRQPA
ncbi:MAG: permease [Lysobacterales bacterium CG02_land_8_20_14_3_00_62_12]|nr:MAG: permease [Xanthomonadales bacterium CG02_land_8_20_14_3_00_62_12]